MVAKLSRAVLTKSFGLCNRQLAWEKEKAEKDAARRAAAAEFAGEPYHKEVGKPSDMRRREDLDKSNGAKTINCVP